MLSMVYPMKIVSRWGLLLLVGLISLPLTSFSDTLVLKDGTRIVGYYDGGTLRVVRFQTELGLRVYDLLSVARIKFGESSTMDTGAANRLPTSQESQRSGSLEGTRRSGEAFGQEEARLIRDWFSIRTNLESLPRGLAKREKLPPGLGRQVERTGTLPPGLQRRLQPLPPDLERQLPDVLVGMRRVILGRDVVLLVEATSRIVDLIRNVF